MMNVRWSMGPAQSDALHRASGSSGCSLVRHHLTFGRTMICAMAFRDSSLRMERLPILKIPSLLGLPPVECRFGVEPAPCSIIPCRAEVARIRRRRGTRCCSQNAHARYQRQPRAQLALPVNVLDPDSGTVRLAFVSPNRSGSPAAVGAPPASGRMDSSETRSSARVAPFAATTPNSACGRGSHDRSEWLVRQGNPAPDAGRAQRMRLRPLLERTSPKVFSRLHEWLRHPPHLFFHA